MYINGKKVVIDHERGVVVRTGTNIRQRADGRFEARYPKGKNEQGRTVYGCCYGRTYEEAAEKRAAILQKERTVREMKLLILGAGSHGAEVKELAESLRVFRDIAFLDDYAAKTGVIGPCTDAASFADRYPVAIPAVGDRELRMRWLAQLVDAGFVLPVLIHPGAMVSPSAAIDYGTVICARATIGAGAVIGKGCIISSGATIDRYQVIPDGTHVTCGQVVTSATQIR